MKRFLIAMLISFSAALPMALPALADEEAPQPINIGNPLNPDFGSTQKPTPTDVREDTVATVQGQLANLLNIMLRGIAALSLLPIVVGGFQMIISQGDDSKVSRGKETVYWGVVGLILSLVAIALFRTFLAFLVKY